MLEVVFSDSAKGSFMFAKNYDEKSMSKGATGYIGRKPSKEELARHFEGQALGGSSKDVVNIGFFLDVGDISDEFDGQKRMDVFKRVWGRFDFNEKESEQFFESQRKDMQKLTDATENGESIRIWTSNAPYSMCGFYYICHKLMHADCSVSVISLPISMKTEDKKLSVYSDWTEIQPGKLYQFLQFERPLSPIEINMYACFWSDLVAENAPLRAVLNGKLISVQENFYDFLIEKHIPDGNFNLARLIGDILGKYSIGVSDSWYALRIDKMITDKKLEVVSIKDPTHPYSKILRKVKV